jgi:aminoglycoside 2''-phosphotransferase
MIPDSFALHVRALLPSASITPLGEGDYARAFRVAEDWTFLLARHDFAATCFEFVARLSPTLAAGAPLPLPDVKFHGNTEDGAFIGYAMIPGTPLSRAQLEAFTPRARDIAAAELGALFTYLHAFDTSLARQAGVPSSAYPFAMLEDEFRAGDEATLYAEDLERLGRHDVLQPKELNILEQRVASHLGTPRAPLVLLHNEVSDVHALHDPSTQRLTGIIDLNGMILGPPARDFMYLREDYGADFTRRVLQHTRLELEPTLLELEFLHLWHTAARLLWALEHRYIPGITRHLETLHRWL